MGISSLFASLLKGITWTKVATVAMEYGPVLYRQARERFRQEPPPAEAEGAEIAGLQERVAELEKLLQEREVVIRDQATTIGLQEKRRLELENSLFAFKVGAGVLTLCCIILLAIIFK